MRVDGSRQQALFLQKRQQTCSASESNRYLIRVTPGTYSESSLVEVPGYVHLQGDGPDTTIVTSDRGNATPNQSAATIAMLENSYLSDIGVRNSGNGPISFGIYMAETNDEPQILQFSFDEGLEGWTPGHMGGEYDSAKWSDDHGNPPGSVRLDGSDLGTSDGQPNAWMSRSITLPSDFDLLYFETKANMDGALRVRLVDDDGASHILLPWEVLAGDTWRERTADIGLCAGQLVTLYFEQGDNDVGNGEHRYVDNVILCQSALPTPRSKRAPRTLTVCSRPWTTEITCRSSHTQGALFKS